MALLKPIPVPPRRQGVWEQADSLEEEQNLEEEKPDVRLECEEELMVESESQLRKKMIKLVAKMNLKKHPVLRDQIMRNREDVDVELSKIPMGYRVSTKVKKLLMVATSQGFIIHPGGKFKTIWDPIMALGLLWSITISPIRVSLLYEQDMVFLDIVDSLIDILFFTDFILKFMTGYYQYGRLIKSKRVEFFDLENNKKVPQQSNRLSSGRNLFDSFQLTPPDWQILQLEFPADKHVEQVPQTAEILPGLQDGQISPSLQRNRRSHRHHHLQEHQVGGHEEDV